MKYGFNMLLWTGHVTQEHVPLFKALKKAGYDGVEFPLFEGTPDHYARLGEHLDKLGLERSTVSVLGAGHNPLSPDKAQQADALARAKWAVDCTAALGANILAGPMHSEIGYFSGGPATKQEHQRGVSFHRRAGDHAAKKNVRFAVEALNRFECYFLNTATQAADLIKRVGAPNVGYLYDTFHFNIEEDSITDVIPATIAQINHVHISENNRGVPGAGHIDFASVFKALKAAGYDRWMTIESFGSALPDLAAATKIWRPIFKTETDVYRHGYRLMRDGWDAA